MALSHFMESSGTGENIPVSKSAASYLLRNKMLSPMIIYKGSVIVDTSLALLQRGGHRKLSVCTSFICLQTLSVAICDMAAPYHRFVHVIDGPTRTVNTPAKTVFFSSEVKIFLAVPDMIKRHELVCSS